MQPCLFQRAGVLGKAHGVGKQSLAPALMKSADGCCQTTLQGRDSPYHPGTEFLGTPKNHLEVGSHCHTCGNLLAVETRGHDAPVLTHFSSQLVAKRPVSPHVFEIDGRQPHYKFPIGAISSITNRATGVMLSVGEQPLQVLLPDPPALSP